MTSAVEVDIDIAALVDSNLSCHNHYGTVGHSCDVDRTVDTTRNDEALSHVLDSKTRKCCTRGSWDRHVDNAALEISKTT